MKGTLGALPAGEWAWGDNDNLGFNALYYKPATGENIATAHVEVNQNDPVWLYGGYQTIRNFKVFFGDEFSIKVIGANCSIEDSQFRFGGVNGVQIYGPNARAQNSISYESQRGFTVTDSGDNAILYNNVAFNNDNEGFLVNAGAQSVTIKNCIGSENAGDQFSLTQTIPPGFVAEYNDWYGANNAIFNNYISSLLSGR